MNKDLKEWTIAFVKHKDSAFKKLLEIKEREKENKIDFKFTDKLNVHFIAEKLDENVFKLVDKVEQRPVAWTVVCLNTEENFNFLIKNWKKIAGINNLSFIFVSLKNQEKWIINPHVHNMIADSGSLETGLRAMFDTCNGKIIDVMKGKKRKVSMFEEGSPLDSEEGDDEI